MAQIPPKADGKPVNAELPAALSIPARTQSVWFLTLVCLVASLGGLLFGFDTAVISGTVGSVEAQYHLSKLQVGWFTSSALVGCVLGAIFAGGLGDRFGRKPILMRQYIEDYKESWMRKS